MVLLFMSILKSLIMIKTSLVINLSISLLVLLLNPRSQVQVFLWCFMTFRSVSKPFRLRKIKKALKIHQNRSALALNTILIRMLIAIRGAWNVQAIFVLLWLANLLDAIIIALLLAYLVVIAVINTLIYANLFLYMSYLQLRSSLSFIRTILLLV